MDWIADTLRDVVATILQAALALAAAYAVYYLDRLRRRIETETSSRLLHEAVYRATHLVQTGILAAESRAAAELREAVRSGKASHKDLAAIGGQVVADVLSHLDRESRAILAAYVGDLQDWISDLVEARLEALKVDGAVGALRDLAAPKSSAPASASDQATSA